MSKRRSMSTKLTCWSLFTAGYTLDKLPAHTETDRSQSAGSLRARLPSIKMPSRGDKRYERLTFRNGWVNTTKIFNTAWEMSNARRTFLRQGGGVVCDPVTRFVILWNKTGKVFVAGRIYRIYPQRLRRTHTHTHTPAVMTQYTQGKLFCQERSAFPLCRLAMC